MLRNLITVLIHMTGALGLAAAQGEPVKLAGGEYHMCCLFSDGSVKCWGGSPQGQLGRGNTEDIGDEPGEVELLLPLDFGTGVKAADLVSGDYHSCILTTTGDVKCWGSGSNGQLGTGATEAIGDNPGEMADALVPVDLGTELKATAVATGQRTTFVTLSDGTVRSFGWNALGVCGQDTNTDVVTVGSLLKPLDFGGRKALNVTGGLDHACVLLDDYSVRCFGSAQSGQIGSGGTEAVGDAVGDMAALAAVDFGISNASVVVTAIVAGGRHTNVLFSNGKIKSFGANGFGQLGVGDQKSRGDQPEEMGSGLEYTDLGTDARVMQLCAGYSHTCALLETREIKCWGEATTGAIGSESTYSVGAAPGQMGDKLLAVDLGGDGLVMHIAAGGSSTCAIILLNSGEKRIKCFGYSEKGGLGLGYLGTVGDEPGEMGSALPFVAVDSTWTCDQDYGFCVSPSDDGIIFACCGDVGDGYECGATQGGFHSGSDTPWYRSSADDSHCRASVCVPITIKGVQICEAQAGSNSRLVVIVACSAGAAFLFLLAAGLCLARHRRAAGKPLLPMACLYCGAAAAAKKDEDDDLQAHRQQPQAAQAVLGAMGAATVTVRAVRAGKIGPNPGIEPEDEDGDSDFEAEGYYSAVVVGAGVPIVVAAGTVAPAAVAAAPAMPTDYSACRGLWSDDAATHLGSSRAFTGQIYPYDGDINGSDYVASAARAPEFDRGGGIADADADSEVAAVAAAAPLALPAMSEPADDGHATDEGPAANLADAPVDGSAGCPMVVPMGALAVFPAADRNSPAALEDEKWMVGEEKQTIDEKEGSLVATSGGIRSDTVHLAEESALASASGGGATSRSGGSAERYSNSVIAPDSVTSISATAYSATATAVVAGVVADTGAANRISSSRVSQQEGTGRDTSSNVPYAGGAAPSRNRDNMAGGGGGGSRGVRALTSRLFSFIRGGDTESSTAAPAVDMVRELQRLLQSEMTRPGIRGVAASLLQAFQVMQLEPPQHPTSEAGAACNRMVVNLCKVAAQPMDMGANSTEAVDAAMGRAWEHLKTAVQLATLYGHSGPAAAAGLVASESLKHALAEADATLLLVLSSMQAGELRSLRSFRSGGSLASGGPVLSGASAGHMAVANVIVDATVIGRGGAFSRVHAGAVRSTARSAAIKVMEGVAAGKRDNVLGNLAIELPALLKLQNPNVISVYGVVVTDVWDEVWLVHELAPLGSLREQLNRSSPGLTEAVKLRCLTQVASGMIYLHTMDIQHRNLKASNVFLSSDMTAKISDFGLPRTTAAFTGTEAGRPWLESAPWAAPEVLHRQGHLMESDVYSFGVVIFETLTATEPAAVEPYDQAAFVKGLLGQLKRQKGLAAKLRPVIKACLDARATRRPAFRDVRRSFGAIPPPALAF